MLKRIFVFIMLMFYALPTYAGIEDFDKYFNVKMDIELPDLKSLVNKYFNTKDLYDKGFTSRLKMGNRFKKEFSKTIKFYGLSEKRLKNNYEDELLEVISWMPKEMYQYIGPMLHEVPGMSEKILNLPGIKETKNQFPKDVAQKMLAIEGIEYISPAFYVLLMPEIWGEKDPNKLDNPKPAPVKKPKPNKDIPDFLKKKLDMPVKALPVPSQKIKKKSSVSSKFRTISPTLISPLTTKDAEAFVETIDELEAWGNKDDMFIYSEIISGQYLLDMWELEQGVSLYQNDLKDVVNPCQRLVLKIKFAGLYEEFKSILSKHGYTPEEWAYVGDKTIKAFRVASASLEVAYAVNYHKKGYYNHYIERLPEKWKQEMYANEAAIVKMYAVFREDVEAVKPLKDKINTKFLKLRNILLTAPIIY